MDREQRTSASFNRKINKFPSDNRRGILITESTCRRTNVNNIAFRTNDDIF